MVRTEEILGGAALSWAAPAMGTGSAPVTAAIAPGGRRRAGSCRARADRLVLREAVQALLVKLLIRYRPTLAAHARLMEPGLLSSNRS